MDEFLEQFLFATDESLDTYLGDLTMNIVDNIPDPTDQKAFFFNLLAFVVAGDLGGPAAGLQPDTENENPAKYPPLEFPIDETPNWDWNLQTTPPLDLFELVTVPSFNLTVETIKTVKAILSWYDSYHKMFDLTPWYIWILDFVAIPDWIIKVLYLINNLDYADAGEILIQSDGESAVTRFMRLNDIFPNQSYQTYMSLYKNGSDMLSQRMTESYEPVLRALIVDKAPIAMVPQHIISGTPDLVKIMDIVNRTSQAGLLTPKELTAGYEGLGLNISRREAVLKLRALLNGQPGSVLPFAAEGAIAKARLNLGSNRDLFRLFGPVNVQVADQLQVDDECSNFGGCRMLVCRCFEGSPLSPSTEREDHWFTGYCDYCLNQIESYRHAVRIPFLVGGWVGCFCSWDCCRRPASLEKYIVLLSGEEIYERVDVETELASANSVFIDYINKAEYVTSKNGIYDGDNAVETMATLIEMTLPNKYSKRFEEIELGE